MVDQEEQSTESGGVGLVHTKGFVSLTLRLESVHLLEADFSLVATGGLHCHTAGIHVQNWHLLMEKTHSFLISFSCLPVTSCSSFSKDYQCLLEELQKQYQKHCAVRRSHDRRKCCHVGIATYSPSGAEIFHYHSLKAKLYTWLSWISTQDKTQHPTISLLFGSYCISYGKTAYY